MTRTLFELCAEDSALRFSPYVWRAKMALAHKGLEYETQAARFLEKEAYAESGSKTVPVLNDGGTWVADSWAIACHLEDTYPDNPSLFGGPGGRDLSHVFNLWVDRAVLIPLFLAIGAEIPPLLPEKDAAYFRETREKRIGMSLAESAEKAPEHLARFAKTLGPVGKKLEETDFIGGQKPLYADYILFGPLQWARIVSRRDDVLADLPVVADWFGRMLDLYGGLGRKARTAHGN